MVYICVNVINFFNLFSSFPGAASTASTVPEEFLKVVSICTRFVGVSGKYSILFFLTGRV